MAIKMKLLFLLAISLELAVSSVVISPIEGGQTLSVFHSNGELRLRGQLGNLPKVIQSPTSCGAGCFSYMDYANLTIEENGDCTTVQWTSHFSKNLRDCFLIENHWYGGGETYFQYWPIESLQRWETPFVTGDSMSNADWDYGGVSESYWLVSSGIGIYVDDDIPLFVSTNDKMENHVCFAAKPLPPFKERRDVLKLRYTMCTAENVKAAHMLMHERFLDKPTGLPDTGMLLRPFWSTWAQFKENVDESIVVNFAQTITQQGFSNSSHIEIDDNWETCYGDAEFNSEKFPDVRRMVTSLNNMGYRVTLWIHPFVNMECSSFAVGHQEGYFVKTDKEKTGITSWWQGRNAGLVDYSNEAAVSWWVGRLEKLRQDFGIDSFKFDAGETNWMPYASVVNGDRNLMPNLYSEYFTEVMASFGGLVEVRTVRKSQRFPIFVRMLDKHSRWGYDNGLKSLIPSLLHFGLQGYPFVLPDMIGGNAYEEGRPPRQLYIRWMQANVLMPSVQFSIAPWDYDDEVVEICKEVLQIRIRFEEEILAAARQSIVDGSPINRPMWWADPENPITHTIDDQYLLGDGILVAPVLNENANTRNIFLPAGQWTSLSDNVNYSGPIWLNDYPADIRTVPIFTKNVLKN